MLAIAGVLLVALGALSGGLLLAAALGLAFAQYLSPAMLNEIAALAMCV